jgi:plastocyanin
MTEDTKSRSGLWFFIILLLIVFVGAVAYFGRGDAELAKNAQFSVQPLATRSARVYSVFYSSGVFSPTNIRIHAGDSVKFENDAEKSIHILTNSSNGIPDLVDLDSGSDIQPKNNFTYTFEQAGTFGYHNALKSSETGTVIVRP